MDLNYLYHRRGKSLLMDFDDISRVVPWIEMSPVLGVDLNAPQRAEPRGFKSHLGYGRIPKGARYVVSLRDPKDSFFSMYRFMGFSLLLLPPNASRAQWCTAQRPTTPVSGTCHRERRVVRRAGRL